MGNAFKVDGVVLEGGNEKLLLYVRPSIIATLANWLVGCPPDEARTLQKQIDKIDRDIFGLHEQISSLYNMRANIKNKICITWHASSDKRHLAVQALGHKIRNCLPVFSGESTPEDLGIEIFDDDDGNEE